LIVKEDKSSLTPSLSRATAKGEEESLLSSPSLRENLVIERYEKKDCFYYFIANNSDNDRVNST